MAAVNKAAGTEEKENSGLFEKYIQKERRKKNRFHLCFDLIVTAAVVFLLFQVIAGIAVVRGDSMKPNVTNGSVALFYRLGRTYQRNDIVIFQAPGHSEVLIKRIVAVAGDQVDIDDKKGNLIVNGAAQQNDAVIGKTYTRDGGISFPLTVPANCVFVLGDNRESALDSRNLGAISTAKLMGRVVFEVKNLAD